MVICSISKAFGRVDHFLLGEMLLYRGIPSDVFHLVMFYLRNQMARVRWGTLTHKTTPNGGTAERNTRSRVT